MHFRGIGFDFCLRREDFEARRGLRNAWSSKGGASLRHPKGVSSHHLSLVPGRLVGERFAADPKRWSEVQEALAAWESGAYTTEPSLFPPIRPVPAARPRTPWTHYVVPPLLTGALLGAAGLVLPIEPTNGAPPPSPWTLAFAGVLFGLMWPFVVWTTHATTRSLEREVERARKQTADA